MRYRVYAVLDKAVQAYGQPLIFRSEGEAKRSFADAVASKETNFSKYKSDYAFCFLGFFDDSLGAFVDTCAPVVVAEAATILAEFSAALADTLAPG